MNKVCKEYISDAKKFFPIMGKDERNYLRGLSDELEEFCEDNGTKSKQELYEQYRKPYEIANDYYESVDTERIIKKIKISKYIKTLVAIIIAVILAVFSIRVFDFFQLQSTYNNEQIICSGAVVKNSEPSKKEPYDVDKSNDFIEDNEIIEEEIIE